MNAKLAKRLRRKVAAVTEHLPDTGHTRNPGTRNRSVINAPQSTRGVYRDVKKKARAVKRV